MSGTSPPPQPPPLRLLPPCQSQLPHPAPRRRIRQRASPTSRADRQSTTVDRHHFSSFRWDPRWRPARMPLTAPSLHPHTPGGTAPARLFLHLHSACWTSMPFLPHRRPVFFLFAQLLFFFSLCHLGRIIYDAQGTYCVY